MLKGIFRQQWAVAVPIFSPGQTKKVSAWTNMAQIFTGGRAVFFLLKFFTRKSGMPISTFQEQGTVTG